MAPAFSSSDHVDQEAQRELIGYFSSFETRNTNSPQLQTATMELATRLKSIPNLKSEVFEYHLPASPRVPMSKTVGQVIATLPGEDTTCLIVGGHLDSLNLSVDVLSGPAPGANDDLSGVAVMVECARILSQLKWKHTIHFVAFTGEEQGLIGATALANRALQENWSILAVLNNDTVGSVRNRFGEENSREVRLFSELNDTSQSRELARFIDWLTRVPSLAHHHLFDPGLIPDSGTIDHSKSPEFGVKLVQRLDRFGRGGDHMPFHKAGFSAVRFIEVCEDVTVQHTPDDQVNLIDFDYLANVTRLNLLALSALANSEPAPSQVGLLRDQSRNTTLRWTGSSSAPSIIFWRDSRSSSWEGWQLAHGSEVTIAGINKDDHIFGVASLGGIPLEVKQFVS